MELTALRAVAHLDVILAKRIFRTKMIKETFYEYQLIGKPVKMKTGKWAVSVIIEKNIDGKRKSETYLADDNIHYILEIEAAKEGINLGKNLIYKNHIVF